MVTFSSTFSAGGNVQSFSAKVQGHNEDVRSTVMIHANAVFENASAWGNMARLRTWKYSVREVPGAATVADAVVVQALGGPGFGSLNIDAYSSWTAMLTDMQLDTINPRLGLVYGRLTFLMQPS
jgi:hypothetical protein